MSTLADPARFARTAFGWSMIGAGVLLLVSSVVSPAIKSDEAAQIAVIAQHPARYYLFTIFILGSSMLFVPAIIGLMTMSAERSPKLTNLGGLLAMFGSLVAVGDSMSQLVIWQMGAHGADRTQMAALLNRFDDVTGSALVFTIGGLATVVGVLLLSIALYRAHAVPAWAAAGLVAGVVLNIVGFSAASIPVLILSSVVLLAALGWIGVIVLRGETIGTRAAASPSASPA